MRFMYICVAVWRKNVLVIPFITSPSEDRCLDTTLSPWDVPESSHEPRYSKNMFANGSFFIPRRSLLKLQVQR